MSRGYSVMEMKWQLIYLKEALRDRNIIEFRNGLELVNKSVVTDDSYLSVFEKALQTRGCAALVEECIKFGFDPNHVNKYGNKSALNFAADSQDPNILKVLLETKKVKIYMDFKYNGMTPLNFLAKNLRRQNINDITKCVQILLKYGASPNIADPKGITPLHYVVENDILEDVMKRHASSNIADSEGMTPQHDSTIIEGIKKQIKNLIDVFLTCPHLDIDAGRKGQLRTILVKKYPDIKLPPSHKRGAISYDTLLKYIHANDMDSFKTDFKSNLRNTTQKENEMLLIESIEWKRNWAFDMLMETDIDYNTKKIKSTTPLEMSVNHGNCYTLARLLKKPDILIRPCYYPLKEVILKINESGMKKSRNYLMCFYTLLDSDKINVNEPDLSNSTALHYAVKYRYIEMIEKLLQRGADITKKNIWNKIPIDGMNPEVLKKHFDHCITCSLDDSDDSHSNDDDDDDSNNEIGISFKNLRPTNSLYHKRVEEMKCIEFMAKSENYRDLLKHPVITSYLFLKWHKHSLLFYINFCFYIFYVISVITYSVLKFKKTEYKTLLHITQDLSIIGFLYMSQREFFQFVTSPKRYICTFSNYAEIALILLSFATLLEFDYETERQLVIFTILLAVFVLYLQVGSIPVPSISTHMLMLEAVFTTFLKCFLLYSIFITTFPLCFYILYSKSADANKTDGDGGGESEDYFRRFRHPLPAISKTLVMLTGEIDAASLNLGSNCSYVVFLLFVFFMTITLYNLLNGMAVSDTQAIKDQAEINFSICRIKSLTGYEKTCFGRGNSDDSTQNENTKPLRSMWRELFNGYSRDAVCSKIYILPFDDNKIILSRKKQYFFTTNNDKNSDTAVRIEGERDKLNSGKRTKKCQELLPSWISSKNYAQMDTSTIKMAMSILEERYKDMHKESKDYRLDQLSYKVTRLISNLKKYKNSNDSDTDTDWDSDEDCESNSEPDLE